ncbi:MAG: hypothetical protein VB025_07955 [Sphaerochaeta sp.]|nr:hypothetical protein [Sphaerochaeta sp.]
MAVFTPDTLTTVIARELLVIYNLGGNERSHDEQNCCNAKSGSHIFDQSAAFPATF